MKRLCSAALSLTTLFTLVIGIALWANRDSPPTWTYVQQMPASIPPDQDRYWLMTDPLPAPPFMLEVTGRFSMRSPASAQWGINLDVASLRVSNDRQFLAPNMPNPIWFYGLRADGASNQISLIVARDGQAEVRLNGQVVWGELLPASPNGNHIWALLAESDLQSSATFTLQRVAIYVP